jgi:hypothetical protein
MRRRVRMKLFTCQRCGERIVTFDSATQQPCPACGAAASTNSGLVFHIPIEPEEATDFPELAPEARAPREDLVQLFI